MKRTEFLKVRRGGKPGRFDLKKKKINILTRCSGINLYKASTQEGGRDSVSLKAKGWPDLHPLCYASYNLGHSKELRNISSLRLAWAT